MGVIKVVFCLTLFVLLLEGARARVPPQNDSSEQTESKRVSLSSSDLSRMNLSSLENTYEEIASDVDHRKGQVAPYVGQALKWGQSQRSIPKLKKALARGLNYTKKNILEAHKKAKGKICEHQATAKNMIGFFPPSDPELKKLTDSTDSYSQAPGFQKLDQLIIQFESVEDRADSQLNPVTGRMPITLTKWKAYFARRGREAEKLFNSEMDLIKTASQTVIDTLSDAFIIKDNLEEPMKIGQKSMNIEEKAALLRMVIALGEKLGCTHKNWDDDRSDEDD
ncbi:unnamed protein product [Bemisia tabaci]|uniref:Uncharacterized protein n=2 Tax=Bemisia tabaci TaxID=7038 RepID=A0A9P0F7H1_BEMTA|nr:unnamed protein product [Bemisia tabaci]